MPSMANITVKNGAAADVVYVASVPSAGDKTPAKWTENAASGIVGHRPTLTMGTRDNGSKNARVVDLTSKTPIVELLNGVPTVVASVVLSTQGSLPTNVDATKVADAFIKHGNLIASALIRQAAQDGYAPT